MFCLLVDSIENYIFKEIAQSYISFGIMGLLVVTSDCRDDLMGLFYQ